MSLSRRKLKKAGFTLVELLVTISIFAILTGVVLFSQSKFNSTILLTNLAYDTALTVREAQTYGINIKNFTVGDANNFSPYGVHFDMNNTKSFVLFADLDTDGYGKVVGNGIYDGLATSCSPRYTGHFDGCVNRYNIKNGNAITDLCSNTGGIWTCHLSSIDVVFKRPNPDAILSTNGSTVTGLSAVSIKLGNPTDSSNSREVIIQPNGLIYVK